MSKGKKKKSVIFSIYTEKFHHSFSGDILECGDVLSCEVILGSGDVLGGGVDLGGGDISGGGVILGGGDVLGGGIILSAGDWRQKWWRK